MTEDNQDRDEEGHFLVGHSLGGPGRKSLYDPSMNDVARKLALLGMIDEDMAAFFGVTAQTFYNWQNEFPAFFEAVQSGKIVADANVADSLYKRATGEHVQVEKVVKAPSGESEVIKVMTYIPGESGAALNWLKNRQPGKWRDMKAVELSGNVTLSHEDALRELE